MYLALTTPPADTAVSLSEAKAHLRVLHNNEDALIQSALGAAIAYADGRNGVLGRALVTQQYEYRLDCFPACGFELPLPPLQSVESIEYIDPEGVLQTLSTDIYEVSTGNIFGHVRLKYGQSFPSTRPEFEAVRVNFTAGYGATGDVPLEIKQAILLLVGHYYNNRQEATEAALNSIPMGVNALLSRYKVQM